jgi:hypothetical protein
MVAFTCQANQASFLGTDRPSAEKQSIATPSAISKGRLLCMCSQNLTRLEACLLNLEPKNSRPIQNTTHQQCHASKPQHSIVHCTAHLQHVLLGKPPLRRVHGSRQAQLCLIPQGRVGSPHLRCKRTETKLMQQHSCEVQATM